VDERIENILKSKLSDKDFKEVSKYIQNHENKIRKLEASAMATSQLLQILVSNLQAIQASLDTCTRELVRFGVVKIREM